MVVKGLKKKAVHQQKKIALHFVVDCAKPVADKVLDVAGLVCSPIYIFWSISSLGAIFPGQNQGKQQDR